MWWDYEAVQGMKSVQDGVFFENIFYETSSIRDEKFELFPKQNKDEIFYRYNK